MHDKDSQLIYEAYTGSIISEIAGPEANVDPLAWDRGDIITLKVGPYDLNFVYRSHQSSRSGSSYFQKLQPAEDYSKYGALPNITTGDEGPNIIYTNSKPINVDADVIRKGKANKYGHSTKVVGYQAGTPAGTPTGAKPGDESEKKLPLSRRYYDIDPQGEPQMRWTQKPEHRHGLRAAIADRGYFKNADVKTAPMKWAANQIERGFQNILAPGQKVSRSGTSRFASDPKRRYTGPSPGDKEWMGDEYEGAAKRSRKGKSTQRTS